MIQYKKISILVPVYNEEDVVAQTLENILAVDFGIEKEILVVNDHSSDGTAAILERFTQVRVISNQGSRGRSAALVYGLGQVATGDVIGFQDADAEIHPSELLRLYQKMNADSVSVVSGSRFPADYQPKRFHYYGNKAITVFANLLNGTRLSDLETGVILIDRKLIDDLKMQSRGWDFSIELQAKLARRKIPVEELAVRYSPRTVEMGKKITWFEGFRALKDIIRYRFGREK